MENIGCVGVGFLGSRADPGGGGGGAIAPPFLPITSLRTADLCNLCRGGSRISERGGESDSGKGHAPPARGYGGAL